MKTKRPRGTGHVYRPKFRNGAGEVVEQAVWWIAYHAGGELVRESSGTASRKEAERLLRTRTAAVDQGRIVNADARRTTLEDLGAIVKTDYENNGREPREVVRAFARLGEFFAADCPAQSITVDRVEKYKAARRRAGAANATINRELAQLRRAFRLAVRLRRSRRGRTSHFLREADPRRGFFEADQFQAVLRELPDYLQPVVTFLYWTGWRKQEALSLEWRQVDRKAGVLRIDKTKNREPRTIPCAALPVLRDVVEEQWRSKQALEREGIVTPWVFQREGRRILAFMGAWHGACRRAGLPGRLVHDFRRTAARNMVRAGIPQAVAMKIGGWKTDSIFRRYAIVDERLLAENLTKLAASMTVK